MAKERCFCLNEDEEGCEIGRLARAVSEAYPRKEDISVNGYRIIRRELERLRTTPPTGALKINGEYVCTRPYRCEEQGGIVLAFIALAKA